MEKLSELSHRDFLKLDRDYSRAASVADLIYVNDSMPGIKRLRKGRGFSYLLDKKTVTDRKLLHRIRRLAIPPAWTNVWICPQENGHIQATGYDARGRKQYRYHALWHHLRNETKFHRLYEFGKLLPSIRLKIEEDLARKELCEEKVLATVISLMERTYIRIGSGDYEKQNGSYGITTLKDRHVKVNGHTIHFCFRGKKGVEHHISITSRRLARMVKQCRDLPGKELFQYIDSEDNRRPVDSGMVNRYIRDASGGDFSAKDFRTWAGTLDVLRAFAVLGEADTLQQCRKNITAALDYVSGKLGNSRTVCRKYYVHPGILQLYEEHRLDRFLRELDRIEESDELSGLTTEERLLMKILKDLV